MSYVEDFIQMIPITETRTCAYPQCNAYTWWAKPRQPKHGTCGDHFPGSWSAIPTPQLHGRALENLLRVFPGASISDYVPHVYRPGSYVGRDAGPCVDCRKPVRRYGPFAATRCSTCFARHEGVSQ